MIEITLKISLSDTKYRTELPDEEAKLFDKLRIDHRLHEAILKAATEIVRADGSFVLSNNVHIGEWLEVKFQKPHTR